MVYRTTKKGQKYLVLGPGVQRNVSVIKSYTNWIQFTIIVHDN